MNPRVKESEMLKLLDLVADGLEHGIVISGSGGTGKTYNIVEHLKEKETPFIYANNHTTPLGMYMLLYENRDTLLILDDVDGILQNKKIVSLLKAVLGKVGKKGDRIVSYTTTSPVMEKMMLPSRFLHKSGLVIITNESPADNLSVKALLSRCLTYNLEYTYEEKIFKVRSILEGDLFKKYSALERESVLKFFEEQISPSTRNFSLRFVGQFLSMCKAHPKDWQQLALTQLDDPDKDVRKVLLELDPMELTSKAKVELWKQKTGLSRSQYYVYRKRFGTV